MTGRADFVQNKLVVITPPDNPADITSLEDLAEPGVQVVLAAEGVPVGDYARQALESAGLTDAVLANVVSNEEDDASVVAKITAGEADAAIVYVSDVTSAVAPRRQRGRDPRRRQRHRDLPDRRRDRNAATRRRRRRSSTT